MFPVQAHSCYDVLQLAALFAFILDAGNFFAAFRTASGVES